MRAAQLATFMGLLGLTAMTLWPSVALAKRAKRDPHQLTVDRHTLIADRRPDRLGEWARRLVAQDRFLVTHLQVPASWLSRPVSVLYLNRSYRADKKLPWAGDRAGQRYLLPTDTRLWVLMPEQTGLEDIRPAAVQIAELALIRGGGDLPPWLRSGLYELLARVNLRNGNLVLDPSPFHSLNQANMPRAPLSEAGELGWSRYQEPARWYTSCLAVAYLLEEDRDTLARAVRDPRQVSLAEDIDEDAFVRWINRAVQDTSTEPTVLEVGVGVDGTWSPEAISDGTLDQALAQLALAHPKGPKLVRLTPDALSPNGRAQLELLGGHPGDACAALVPRPGNEARYTAGMCLARQAPEAAEALLRLASRGDRAVARAPIEAAALVLSTPGREADARALLDRALQVVPADPDRPLLEAVWASRGGECGTYEQSDPAQLPDSWEDRRVIEGPMARQRDAYVREVLACEQLSDP